MNNDFLKINPQEEKEKIVHFIRETFTKQHIAKVVIGISGGIDSATSFALLKEALNPEDIIVAHLYYFESKFSDMEKYIQKSNVPSQNIHRIAIKKPVDEVIDLQDIEKNDSNKMRIGNIAARMRMIFLYDLAKKYTALVCGTENKSENLLGYFTRFGDQASDIEPIEHLYKTQVYQLAQHLGIPKVIIDQEPSAGLWEGQTDEGQFGFTYKEADQVLYLHFEKKLPIEKIEEIGLSNAKKILDWHTQNLFKLQTPYTVKS